MRRNSKFADGRAPLRAHRAPVLGPWCNILPGRTGLPRFHPQDDPAPSSLPAGSGYSESHRIRPILPVPDTRACKSKESMGVWLRTSRKKRCVHRRGGECLSCDFQCLHWCCCKDVPLENLPQETFQEWKLLCLTQLNLSTAGFQP